MKLNNITKLLITGFTIFLIVSCSSDDDNSSKGNINNNGEGATTSVAVNQIAKNYATIVLANYNDALSDALQLRTALITFTTTPNEENFQKAKNAWLTSRESYGPSEAFRFADGPIDFDRDGEEGPEGLLNSWPLDENFIDYVKGANTAGIINNVTEFPEITLEVLEAKNGDGGDANVSTGYHAIEFLLWGQDNTSALEKLAGQRPFTDFVEGGTSENQTRRSTYILVCANLIIENLESLIAQWEEGGSYRTEFNTLSDNNLLTNLFGSIAELSKSELAVERMDVALGNQDQEDEHSCFSDNTHRDIRLNFEGIENVYYGKYKNIVGESISDLLREKDAEAAKAIDNAFAVANAAIENTAIPFDFAISGGESSEEGAKVKRAVVALQTLGDLLAEGASKLGLQVTVE